MTKQHIIDGKITHIYYIIKDKEIYNEYDMLIELTELDGTLWKYRMENCSKEVQERFQKAMDEKLDVTMTLTEVKE